MSKEEPNNNNEKENNVAQLIELSKKKNKILYNELKKSINLKENEEIKDNIIKIIKNNDESLYKKYFDISLYTTSYNGFILKLLKIVLDSKKNSNSFINEKFITSRIWTDYIYNFQKNNFYHEKYSSIYDIIGKNYLIFNLIQIYRILINNQKIKSNEQLYEDIIVKIYECFYNFIEETVDFKNNINKNKIHKEKNKNSEILYLINEMKDVYIKIFTEINEIIISDGDVMKIIIKKLSEKEKIINKIFFYGILKNSICDISELLSKLLIKMFENLFEKCNEGQTDSSNNENIYKFYFFLIDVIFDNLPKEVEKKLEDISKYSNDDSYYDNNYKKNIELLFNTIQYLFNYLYIFKYNKKKFKKLVELFNDTIIPFLYKTNIKNNKIDQDLYEILYGGLCGLIFKLLIENENIDLNLNEKIPLKNFLFDEIIFYQCIHNNNDKDSNKDSNHFKINSKFTTDHINNLFLLLIIKDFYDNKKNENKIDENIKYFLSKLNDKHMLNFWIVNTVSSWKLNHKDKIKTNKYVGLKNLGNTCYMNSLIQMLYNLNLFRDGIVNCQSNSKETKNNSLFELKKLFFCLQYSDIQYYTPYSFPKNYEKNPLNTNEQKDVDEFFADFMDKLESRLKGTNNENIIKYIFQGQQNDNLNFEGDCPHKRTNISDFYNIQLQVKDKKDIYESLDTFIEGEYMSGDNSILCEKCNKKFPANKNQDFKTLPRVLMFVLKRFEFDYNKMTRYKINDHFEFPLELDMNKYTNDYITGKNKNINNKYLLRGVVIHSGSCENGHYYSIIKNIDSKNEDWFLYNDSIVTKFNINNLKEEAFGDEIKEKNNDNKDNKNNNENTNNNNNVNDNKKDNKNDNTNNINSDKNKDNENKNKIDNKVDNNSNNNNNKNNIDNKTNNIDNKSNNNNKNNTNTKDKINNEINDGNNNNIDNDINKTKVTNIENNKDEELDMSFNNDNDINIINKNKINYQNSILNNINNYDLNRMNTNNIMNNYNVGEINRMNTNDIVKYIYNNNNNSIKDNNTNSNSNVNKNYNYSYSNLYKKGGKSAYLLFYEKELYENCPKFDKIEALNPYFSIPKDVNCKNITQSKLVFNQKIDFTKNMLDNNIIVKSINEEMYQYFLLKKLFSDEYHNFLLALYINLLSYYSSNSDDFIFKIKNKCCTPISDIKFCNYKRKDNFSNLYNYLVNNKILFFQINNNKNTDENKNKDFIKLLFEHLIVFFFNIKIRTTNKKCFGGYVDLIKFFINNYSYCCEYFLEEFCNYNVVMEYLINCPLYEVKKLIVGLINCAMINSMEIFKIKQKKKMNEEREKAQKEEDNEINLILGGSSKKKKNKFNYMDIISTETEDKNDDKQYTVIKIKNKYNNIDIQELNDIKIDKEELVKNDLKEKNIENEYLPNIMIKFINNILALIQENGFNNASDNKFLFYILYKFSLISTKTKEYLIKVIPLLDYMNINLNPYLIQNKDKEKETKIDISKKFNDLLVHDILNINKKEKIKLINDKGALFHYENYFYMLYFNLLTYERNDQIFNFDNIDFIFKLFTEIVNTQDCYIFAYLLNNKCLNNIDRENKVINLIIDILDKIDYNEDINYKSNKANQNSNITTIQNYRNKYELDPRNILLILKLFILNKNTKGEFNKNRIEKSVKKLFELIKKYNKYYNYCKLIIYYIIDLFLFNQILIKEYSKEFKEDFKYIYKWIKNHPISPKLYKIEGLYMYRDDNVNYQPINEQQKKEYDNLESMISNNVLNKIENIIKKKINKDEYLLDHDLINISEFTFANNDQILFDGKSATVKKHLNEMIKIKFNQEIINNKADEIINENNDNNDNNDKNQNKIESKMWIEIDNEKIKINSLYNY